MKVIDCRPVAGPSPAINKILFLLCALCASAVETFFQKAKQKQLSHDHTFSGIYKKRFETRPLSENHSPGDRFCRPFQCGKIISDQYVITEKVPGSYQPQARPNPNLEFFFDQ
jgi:hypothetical protein